MKTKVFSLQELAARRVPAILEDTMDGTRWEIVQHELGGLFIGRRVADADEEVLEDAWLPHTLTLAAAMLAGQIPAESVDMEGLVADLNGYAAKARVLRSRQETT